MIEVKNLKTQYGNKLIHNNLSFTIKENSIFGILGTSGSGKTTLLRQLIGLDAIQSGTIKGVVSPFGVLFQSGALFSSLTLFDNLRIILQEKTSFEATEIDKKVQEKLNMVGLSKEDYSLYPNQLSGGMIKKAALARALVLEPKLLFLDEPSSGLDPKSTQEIIMLIQNLQKKYQLSIVIITHSFDIINSLLDHFILLEKGKIVHQGSTEHICVLKEYFEQ